MTNDKSLIQSCVDHINTAVDVDPWAKELVAEMGKEILEQLNNSNQEVKKTSDADRILKILESAKDKNADVPMSIVRKAFDKLLPSVHPTYTDAEIQKIQDMEQAEIEKAFELGREDAKPKWIPVTEQLPEHGGWYIVTENISEDGDKRVGLTWYSFHGWEWGTKPIAWMPLPEPWKEGE